MTTPDWDADGLELEDVETEDETKEPSMYKVVLLNDDYTDMDFVVVVLKEIYRKSSQDAENVMMDVHKSGSGLAGIFTKDIAETKVSRTHQLARQNEYPLKCKIEKA